MTLLFIESGKRTISQMKISRSQVTTKEFQLIRPVRNRQDATKFLVR